MCCRTPLSLVGARPRGRTRTGVGVSCSPAVSDGTCEAVCACRVMRARHSSANSEVVSCTGRRCPQKAAASRAVASTASAAGWAQTPPWGAQAAWEPTSTSTAVLPGSSERRTRPERDRSTNCKAICICCSFASWCCESQEGALSKITAVCIRMPLLSYRLFLA